MKFINITEELGLTFFGAKVMGKQYQQVREFSDCQELWLVQNIVNIHKFMIAQNSVNIIAVHADLK